MRRALSAAYYGLFHFVLTVVADEVVGKTKRKTPAYSLVYRSIPHRSLRDLCSEVQKSTPAKMFVAYFPAKGFDRRIKAFAMVAIDLQEKRHRADYDPLQRFKISDVALAIESARSALRQFTKASAEQRRLFAMLLLCPPRGGS